MSTLAASRVCLRRPFFRRGHLALLCVWGAWDSRTAAGGRMAFESSRFLKATIIYTSGVTTCELVVLPSWHCFRNPDALDPRLCLVRNVR